MGVSWVSLLLVVSKESLDQQGLGTAWFSKLRG